jgi:crotonobetainyl-CoA:carnitine CoA-transferase CaiB-like acyl-CoA transferase
VAGILAALYQREHTGRGQRVTVAMQHAVLNLCRVKLRDHQRLQHGPLGEYPNEEFGDSVPRSGNASGGGQPGWAVKCAPGGPNDYIYLVVRPVGWEPIANLIGRPELVTDPEWSTPQARLNKLDKMFQLIGEWTMGLGKWQALEKLSEHNIPCGPILSTREIIDDASLATTWSFGWTIPSAASSPPSAARSSCPTPPSTSTAPRCWANTTNTSTATSSALATSFRR